MNRRRDRHVKLIEKGKNERSSFNVPGEPHDSLFILGDGG